MPSRTTDNPLPPAAKGRFRFLTAPFRRFGRWFAHQPRAIQFGLVVVVVAGLAAGGYYAQSVLQKRDETREITAAWREFEEARQKTDLDAMRAALGRVQVVSPNDGGATRYRAMLDRSEADPDTPDLALVFLRHHLRAGRTTDAAREATKVLARYPKHWQSRCVLAQHALAQNDPANAERQLEQLSDPEDPDARVTIPEVLHALALFESLGRDSTALRQVIVRRIVPMTRSAAAANATPTEKAQLITCYLIPFVDRSALSELAPYWAQADMLADAAVNDAIAAGDVATLTQLAQLGPRMRSARVALKDSTPLPDDLFRKELKAVDDRTRRAWNAVREKSPDRPEIYRGLAVLALTQSDVAGAIRYLEEGVAVCGDRPELLALLLDLADKTLPPEAILPFAESLREKAELAKTDPVKWALAAFAYQISRREDLALQACAKARAIQPNHPWACELECRLWVRTGDFLKARDALTPLNEVVRIDPRLTRLHARILVGCGLWITRDEEFQKVFDAQAKVKAKTSAPAVAFLLGILDAPVDADRAAWVAAKAELVLAADRAAPVLARVRAEALYRLADLSATHHPKGGGLPPVWNSDRVVAAMRAFDQLPIAERVEASVLASIAVLQLKGEGNAGAAMRTVEPLLPHEAALDAAQLEAVGTVLVANNRAADAVRVLLRAKQLSRPPSVGCLVALALAHHKNRQADLAEAALADAEQAPGRSDREQAELVAFKLLLKREKP